MALTELESRLEQPSGRYIYRTTLTALVHLPHWTVDGTYTNSWAAPLTLRVLAVFANGSELTERASLALCDATPLSWYWDRSGGQVYVHPKASGSPYDETYTARVSAPLANHYTEDVDGVPYAPRLSGGPAVRVAVPDRFGPVVARGGGTLSIHNGDGSLDWLSGAVPERVTIDLGIDL